MDHVPASPSPARWGQIERLFTRALDLPPAKRDEFLAAACADDDALRREVGNLLAAHEALLAEGGEGDGFLEQLDAERAAALVEPAAETLEIESGIRDALRDRYAVERRLGSGGMGEVFAARDLRHDRMVAIKLVRQDGVTSRLEDRFEREVRMAARLQHPHIVPLYDSGLAAGHRYYVMPLIDGPTLRQRLQGSGRFPVDETLRIIEEIAGALDCAHASGIVHRDIKPENVLLSGGHALVVDFGVARPAADVNASAALTAAGIAVGTPAYMSPEQAAGERTVDGSCDQYALACVAFELLTGRPPFRGETAQAVIAQHLVAPVPALELGAGTASRALDEVMVRALAKEPAARFATTMEFAIALRAASTQTLRKDQATPDQSANPLLADLDTLRLPVGVSARPSQRSSARAAPRAWGTWRAVAALALVATLAAVGLLWLRTTSWRNAGPVAISEMQGALPSVAVLPLKNYSGDQAQDYFADGMTDELTTTLAKISALRVIAHQSVLQFKNSRQSVPEIARLLNVKHVVDGSVLQDGDRVRITATLIDAARNTPIWGERFERQRRDVMALQREVALAIADAIEIALTPEDRKRLETAPQVDPEAFDLYVRGSQARYQLTSEGLRKAVEYFERAIAEDSGYAPAYAGLAWVQAFSGNPSRARWLADQALERDVSLAEPHVALGLVRQFSNWDWAGAEEAFRQAIRLNPGHAEAHHELSMLLMRRKRFDEALREGQHALSLAPMSARFASGVGEVHLYARRYDQAVAAIEKALALDPRYEIAYLWLAQAYGGQERYESAVKAATRLPGLGCTYWRAYLGHLHAVSDKRAEALEVLDALIEERRKRGEGNAECAYSIAMVYAGLGERNQALEWLERNAAPEHWSWSYLAVEPTFSSLHAEPRFQALLRKVGLARSNESHIRGSR